ncbi:unnamed protein product [Ectocarpus sp. 12 AP-2014]
MLEVGTGLVLCRSASSFRYCLGGHGWRMLAVLVLLLLLPRVVHGPSFAEKYRENEGLPISFGLRSCVLHGCSEQQQQQRQLRSRGARGLKRGIVVDLLSLVMLQFMSCHFFFFFEKFAL